MAVEPHAEDRHVDLGLDRYVDSARNRGHGLADFFAEGTQRVEVLAEDLDGDIRPCARQHVIDAVGNRLPDGDVHAGDEREVPAQGIEEFHFAAALHGE